MVRLVRMTVFVDENLPKSDRQNGEKPGYRATHVRQTTLDASALGALGTCHGGETIRAWEDRPL